MEMKVAQPMYNVACISNQLSVSVNCFAIPSLSLIVCNTLVLSIRRGSPVLSSQSHSVRCAHLQQTQDWPLGEPQSDVDDTGGSQDVCNGASSPKIEEIGGIMSYRCQYNRPG